MSTTTPPTESTQRDTRILAGAPPRAGSKVLAGFAHPLYITILRAHADGPLRSAELGESVSWAAQSSLRVAVADLCRAGTLERQEPARGQRGAVTALTAAGQAILPLADSVERWLGHAPQGGLQLGDAAARGIIRVLTTGWDSLLVRAIAERPLTLNELSAGIPELSYPALKRRLAKLRSTHLVKRVDRDNTAAYEATDWLRLAIVPLAVGARWEQEHDPEGEPISKAEVEAAFLLTLPFVPIPPQMTGTCTLAALTAREAGVAASRVAGVTAELEAGRVISCRPGDGSTPGTWALGTTEAWLDAVIGGDDTGLRIGGDQPLLARAIVSGLHTTLFGT